MFSFSECRINYMLRGGLIEHWRQEFWPSADRCSDTATGGNDGDIIQAISVSDMQGSFYVLFFGISIHSLNILLISWVVINDFTWNDHVERLWIGSCIVHRWTFDSPQSRETRKRDYSPIFELRKKISHHWDCWSFHFERTLTTLKSLSSYFNLKPILG